MSNQSERNGNRQEQEEPIPTEDLGAGAVGPGGKIGRYKLLSILGEGGYGIVYLAEQQRPVKRRVALKLIKPGMDSKQVIARFEAERQALALLDHPNIAHVFDAGTTSAGRPYFAMEYVKGIPITEHCDREKLAIEERLRLFLQVCEAVQHAHQKGIIHRDIKPSNIQVSIHGEQVVPKVIDFGVAKAITQPLTERTLVTEQGQFVGTPEYMSPEQAEMTGQDIDTRSDIYSLGAVLYELLTGVLPFDPETLREGGVEHIRHMIREEDPKTPSTRLSTISGEESTKLAQLRRTDIRTLGRQLHGDLDWITIKAMEKDRMHRYQTAHALAEDIQRHLDHRTIAAGPPSKVYRLKKFLRRHRSQVLTGAAVVTLIVALVISLGVLLRDRHKSRQAELLEHRAILSRARELYSDRDLTGALEEVRPILDSRGVGAEARLLLAGILLDGGHPDQAQQELENLLEGEPQTEIAGATHALLARIYWESDLSGEEKQEKVDSHRQQAQELLPETAEANFLRALTAVTISNKLQLLDTALKLEPAHYGSRRLRAYTHYVSRNYEDMEDDALVMTISRPKEVQGYLLRGIARREQGKFDKALEDFDQALGLVGAEDRLQIELYRHRCETFVRQGDYRRLIGEATECAERFGDERQFVFYAFCGHVALGEYDRAMDVFDETVGPGWGAINNFLMWVMKHVLDTLEAGRPWRPEGDVPEEAPLIVMQEAQKYHREYSSRGRRVVTDGWHAAWSPDGKTLAYSTGFHGYSGLALHDIETGRNTLLIVPGKDPEYSPDGRYIAFVRDCQILPLSELASAERRFDHRSLWREEVWIIRADGTEPRRIAQGAGWPSWDDGSKHLFYQSRAKNTLFKVSAVEFDSEPEPVASDPAIWPSVSRDGKVARVDVHDDTLKVTSLASGEPIRSWPVFPSNWGGIWSPSADQLNLGARFRGEFYPPGLWCFDLKTGDRTKWVSGPAINGCWSEDERWFAFSTVPFYEIWVVPSESLQPLMTLREHCSEAVRFYDRMIAAEPKYSRWYGTKATHLLMLGETARAIETLETMDHEAPSAASRVFFLVARNLTRRRDLAVGPNVVVDLARRALEGASSNEIPNARRILGRAYYRAGNWQQSIDTLNKNINASEATAEDHFQLAMAYWMLGQKNEAMEWYQAGVGQMGKTPGILRYLVGFRTEAEELLEIALGDNDPSVDQR
ncbi:MAG: protein kinase domain-containing protein [Planctomycetota bacterium]